MIRRFVEWYLRKYLEGSEYFRKDELAELCERVRKDEAEIKDREWSETLERELLRVEREKHLALVEAEDKVRRKVEEIELYKEKVKAAEDMRFCAVTGAQGNLHIASEMAVKVNELRDVLAKMSGGLLNIEDRARTKLQVLEELGD